MAFKRKKIAGWCAAGLLCVLAAASAAAQSSESVYSLAGEAARTQDLNEKIRLLNRALELWDASLGQKVKAKLLFNRGIAYARGGFADRAFQDFSRAIDVDPTYVKAYNNRGIILAQRGKPDGAIDDYTRAIQGKADFYEAYYNRGNALFEMGFKERAIRDYDRAIELHNRYDQAYNNRGIAYSAEGEYAKAIADYNRALDIRPNDAVYYNNRGVAFAKRGMFEQSLRDLGKAISLDSRNPRFYRNRGIVFHQNGAYRRAKADYSQYLKSVPRDQEVKKYLRLAASKKAIVGINASRRLAAPKKATVEGDGPGRLPAPDSEIAERDGSVGPAASRKKIASPALNERPRRSGASARDYYNRGVVRYRKGDFKRALEDFSQALELEPGDILSLNNRGSSFLAMGDLSSAREDYTRALEIEKGYMTAHFNRGIVYFYEGRYDLASSDFSECIDANPVDEAALQNRGFAYFAQGELIKAMSDFDAVRRINPSSIYARIMRLAIIARTSPGSIESYLAGERRSIKRGAAGWRTSLLYYFTGSLGTRDLLGRANSVKDPAEKRMRLCEAYLYIGLRKNLIEKKEREAFEAYRQSASLAPGNFYAGRLSRTMIENSKSTGIGSGAPHARTALVSSNPDGAFGTLPQSGH